MKPKTSTEQGRASHPCAHRCSACFGIFDECPVCLGAGQLSDRMPASDARADADTLRPLSDYGATKLGLRASALMRLAPEIKGTIWKDAEGFALLAARAAFKACPGLRG